MVSAEEVCEDATEVQRDERKQFVDKEDAEQKQDEGDEGDEGDDDDDEDCAACNFCSFAVTGGIPSFQPIFICHECFNENNTSGEEVPLCICQACADNCHNDNNHDVEYVGMGPCYCDCDHVGNCLIFQKSLVEAERIGVVNNSNQQVSPIEEPSKESQQIEGPARTTYIQDVYDIPILQDVTTAETLVQQAQELIQHSKETFWVDKVSSSNTELCSFELLAWGIYQRHLQHYDINNNVMNGGGAEWWVQVKDTNDKGHAIDLHYDKDEALAESFGIGSFPFLSTVTYLTGIQKASAPTIVFDHTYAQGEEDLMNTMLISRPRIGKHLVFDGTLLHGAPSHSFLKPIDDTMAQSHLEKANSSLSDSTDNKEVPSSPQSPPKNDTKKVRVTFLVNIWKDRRPANVQVLDDTIRQKLMHITNPPCMENPLVMMEQPIPKAEIEKEEDLPDTLRHRIELPFVTKGVTWEDQLNTGDVNDDGGLVVITFPPLPTDDTLMVAFGPGLQAYLDYQQRPEDESEQEGVKKEKQRDSGYC